MTASTNSETTASVTPDYADFEDQRHTQRTVVFIRWFVLIAWLSINHYRNPFTSLLLIVDLIGLGVILINLWLHIRLIRGRPVDRRTAVGISLVDIIAISAGISITNGFENSFFVFYYPALFVLAIVLSSTWLNVLAVSVVAGTYATISLLTPPGVDTSEALERTLATRMAIMFAIVLAANLVIKTERARRRQAVEAERDRNVENMRLQQVAQAAELKAAQDRLQIRRDIHDGIAQSLYALNMNLESAAKDAAKVDEQLSTRLDRLVPLSKQALLEARHYMNDLKPMLLGDGTLAKSIRNLASEFESVAGIPVDLRISGEELEVSVEASAQLLRILQEALSNVLKHAEATSVTVSVDYGSGQVAVCVTDDGQGFEVKTAGNGLGLGLDNISTRAEELGGSAKIDSEPGHGTSVQVAVPV